MSDAIFEKAKEKRIRKNEKRLALSLRDSQRERVMDRWGKWWWVAKEEKK